MPITRIAHSINQHHVAFLLFLDETAAQVPWRAQNLTLDQLCNPSESHVALFPVELTHAHSDLVSDQDAMDTNLLQTVLTM
jgi:hypothetical protein